MKLENEFVVPVGVEQAWDVLLDVPRIAPCLPGAKLDEPQGADREYKGTMKVKLGPITATYKGTIRIEEADESARRAVMRAQARDSRGQGTAAATITSSMEPAGDGTRVKVQTDMRVTGPAAQFGRGVMQDVSAKLLGQFANCLEAEIGREPIAQAEAEAVAEAELIPSEGPSEVVPGTVAAPSPTPPAPALAADVPDVLDLGDASRDAVLKRAVPVLAAILTFLLGVLVGRRSAG